MSYRLASNKESQKITKRLYKESQPQLESLEQPATESENEETTDYEVAAELEILPPLDMHKITRTMIYLENLPEVKTVELIPLADKPSVIVILRRPIHLIEILKTLPEVSQAEVVTEGKLIRIQMKLSGNSMLDEVKKD